MKAPAAYSSNEQDRYRDQVEQAIAKAHKRGQDIELGPARLILTSPNGTRFYLAVSNGGTLSAVAV